MKQLQPNAKEVMIKRYSLRDESGKPTETVKDILARAARVVAQAEHDYRDGSTPQQVERKYVDLLEDFRFMPNGRTLANAGTGWGQLANCFVLPIDDDMGRTQDGLFNTLRNAVLILQSGGGVGFSFGRIRPKGDSIGTSKGKATGAVSFLKIYDTAFWVIGQGGGRRSACMAVLPIHHPDIREFIHCKEKEGVIEHFNISVGITDAFMKAVEKNGNFDLINPRNGEVWETVKARELFDEIVAFAHRNGEPGVLFLDAANRENPTPLAGELEATNPCFSGDTRIPTSFGLLKIKELADLQVPLSLAVDLRSVQRQGVVATQSSPAFLTRKNASVFKLTTKRGYSLTITDNHKLFQENGKYAQLKDLKVGNKICLQSGQGVWSEEYTLPNIHLFGSAFTSSYLSRSACVASGVEQQSAQFVDLKYPDLPSQWSKELGVVIGWLVGDGWITKQSASPLGFAFGKNEDGLEGLSIIQKIMKTFFSKGCVVERERAYQLTFGKIPTAFFESLGVKAVRASEKTVPEGIFGAPKEAVVGFLQGLFSSDGTVQIAKKQRNSIRLASSSSSLLKGVQVLLLNFGILSSIYLRRKTGEKLMPNSNSDLQIYVTKPQYELIISRKSKEKFATEIGFILSSKQKKLQSVLCDMRRGSYKDTFTDVIVSIQPAGNEDVYDITEPQTHSLIANGFVTHNCGEQFLLPFENCCMASINLAEHVSNGRKGIFAYNIDWEKLKETTEWTVRWLDDVIDTNKYVSAVPQLEEAAKRNRRIGVSIMGLADLLYKIGVRYGSREGIDCAGQIMEFIRFHTLRASMQLAQERGAFPGIKGSRYDFSASNAALLKAKQSDVWEPTKPLHPYKSTYKMPKLDWKTLTSDIKKHGVRNSCQNTIQPTGAIATVTGLEGYGCEPVFALSYVMRTHEGAEEIGQDFRELYYESALFKEALERSGITGKKLAAIFEKVREKGTCQGITEVPKAIRDVFVVSGDVCVDEHVEMQAALQRFVDNAISKTINFPAGATVKEVFDAYLKGWRMGLKGMTVYVTGSRNKVVLETSETTKKREEEEKAAAEAAKVANSKKGAIPSQPKPSLNMDRPKVDAAARSQSDEFVGTPLVKMKPGDSVCPECGAELVIQEGCFTCPNCAYSKCSI